MSTLGIFIFLIGFVVLTFGVSFVFFNTTVGAVLLVIGAVFIIMAIVLIYKKIEKQKAEAAAAEAARKQQEEEFELWLTQQGFATSDLTKDFIVDTTNKKWCKKFEKKIFEFAETTGASINKHRSSKTTTSGSSGSSRNSYSTRTSEDTSTYEVLIKTTDIGTPLVIIDCFRDKADAEKICATVDIMRGKKTRNRTKEDDSREQTEVTD